MKKQKKSLGIIMCLMSILFISGCSQEVKNKELTIKFNEQEITGTYTGLYANKSFTDNEATFNYKDGDNYLSYTGGFKEGKLDGSGYLKTNIYTIHFDTNDRTGEYKGDSTNGIPNGNGEFKATNDEGKTYTYVGSFIDGTFNGHGEKIWESDFRTEIGNYTNGNFDPTILEAITYLGSNNKNLDDKKEALFSPNDKASEFIKNNSNLFIEGTLDTINPLLNTDIKFKNITKASHDFGDELIKYDGAVGAINEFEIGCQVWTRVQIYSGRTVYYDNEEIDNTFYYTFYKGKLDGIYDNDKITVYGLPIGTTSFNNVSNTTTQAVVLLDACVIKR